MGNWYRKTALVLVFYLYLSGGKLWIQAGGEPPQAVEYCCPAALPKADRQLLEQGLTAESPAEALAILENFCS